MHSQSHEFVLIFRAIECLVSHTTMSSIFGIISLSNENYSFAETILHKEYGAI